MGFFILTGLLLFVGAIAYFVLSAMDNEGTTSEDRYGNRTTKGGFNATPYKVAVVGAVGVLFVLITLFSVTDTVQNGHIGITKQFGSLVGTTGEGLVTHAPWQSVSEVSVQNELRSYDMTQGNSAVSADSQPVYMVVQVNYSLDRDKAVQLYRETGGHFVDRILDPAVFQNVKEVTAGYPAIDFAKNREQIRLQIERKLSKELRPHGLNINSVALKNVGFTDTLSKAIEQTVEATQQAKREEQRVRIVKAQADQKVAQAKGEATATLTQARADATSYKLKTRSLSPLLIQQQAIDKLNPNVKVIICAPNQVCIPNAVLSVADGK